MEEAKLLEIDIGSLYDILIDLKKTLYHDNTYIIDIENKIEEKLAALEKASPPIR
ncbi:MAG: hypothetical protein ACE5K8_05225 [Candidatus Zixiibacteriota bacterium]